MANCISLQNQARVKSKIYHTCRQDQWKIQNKDKKWKLSKRDKNLITLLILPKIELELFFLVDLVQLLKISLDYKEESVYLSAP